MPGKYVPPVLKECEWKRFPASCVNSPPITVVVGVDKAQFLKVENASTKDKLEQESFIIQKDILCHYSEYFRGALEGGFVEARSGRVTIEDVAPPTFRLINQWLYSGEIDYAGTRRKLGREDSEGRMCLLWVAADRLMMPALKNAAMTVCMKELSLSPPLLRKHITVIWSSTTPVSTLRRFLVAVYRQHLKPDHADAPREQGLPRDMLLWIIEDIAREGLVESWSVEWPPTGCRYHDH